MATKDKAWAIVIFMIFLNAVPGVMVASGLAADMGINPSVSGGDSIGETNDEFQKEYEDDDAFGVSGGFGQTLFALYTSVTGPVQTALGLLIGGELMFLSLGVPGWLVTFMFAPKYFIFGGTVIYVLAGRVL